VALVPRVANREGWSIFLKLLSLIAVPAVGESCYSGITSSASINLSFFFRWLDLNLAMGI
jgi:hypothetical protein